MGAEEQDEEPLLLLSPGRPPATEGRYEIPGAIYSTSDVRPSARTFLLTPSSAPIPVFASHLPKL